ncbi:MAG: apolipoprotein N-acyltransferase [Candidatus Zixiibacteriota bacterium]
MRKRDFYLASLSALLFSLAFPPLHVGFASYFSLVPLMVALENKSPSSAFKMGYVFGLISNSLLLFWVGWATIPGAAAAIMLLCLYTAFLCWFYSFIGRRWTEGAVFFFPFLWVAMEYARSLSEMSFPWLNLSYTQTYYLKLIQHASLWGNYGVSFWVLLLNLLVYVFIQDKKRRWATIILFAILMIVPYIYGSRVMSKKIAGKEIKIALLQGNIEPEVKWAGRYLDYNIETYIDMTKQVAKDSVDLVVWPETAAPCYLAAESLYLAKVQGICDEMNVPLLVGTNDYRVTTRGKLDYYNSAFLFTPHGGYPKVYNKIHLVPFSEKVPYDERLHISEKVPLGQSDFSSGDELIIFNLPEGKFATLICFESVYPAFVRDFVNLGADFLVNITNDGWFGKTHGPFQHARIAVFRAIENRIPIARCANTGVSVFIDPYGRTKKATPIFQRAIVIDKITLRQKDGNPSDSRTFYSRHGDWLAIGCLVISLLAIAVALSPRSSTRQHR